MKISNSFRGLLMIIAACLAAMTGFLQFNSATSERFDACFIKREIQRPPPPWIPLGDSRLHDLSVYIMWLAMIILCLLPRDRIAGFHSLTFSSIWFHTTYILLAAAKAPLNDYNCAGRHPNFPNGISGHYCYFVFVILTAPRFAQIQLRANPNASRAILFLVTFLLSTFSVGAVATLYRTFFHGYHSLRQIFLGISLGLTSHVLLDVLHFENDISVLVQTLVLLSNSILVSAMYIGLWPHHQAGPAISQNQFMFHASLWTILALTGFQLPKARTKQASE